MRVIAIALLISLAGCSHVTVSGGTGNAVPETRSSVTTGSGGLQVHGHASRSLAAVILAGILIGAAYDDVKNDRPFPSLSVFSDWLNPPRPAELLPGRHITEQDCGRAVDLSQGNLRCK